MCAAKVMGLFIKCFNPESNHVVYRPDGSRNLCDPDMNRGLDQRPQVRVQALHPKEEVANYPPHIARTLDGEEGYSECQRYLQSTTYDPTACRPPPNRTIYDGESPPPYRSQSVSHIGRNGQNTKAAAARLYRDPTLVQCFSMSSNNNNTRNSNLNDAPPRHHHHHHQQQQQQQHQTLTAAGGAALPGSYPHHNLTVYGHPPRTCLGPLHLQQQQLSLQEQSQLHHLQQQQQHAQQQHQQQQQQHSLAGIAGHPTTNRHGGGHPEAIAPTPALGPPPNYSDVVNATNYDVFTTSHPDSDV